MCKGRPWPRGRVAALLSIVLVASSLVVPAGVGSQHLAPAATSTFTAVADTYIAEGSPTQNYGTEPQLVVGYAPGNHRRSEIRFDISGLPAEQKITSAILRVYVLDVSGGGATVSARPIQSSWSESTVTWDTKPDIWPPPIDTTAVSASGWASWDVMLQVTAWYTGADTNYGVELGAPIAGDYTIYISSREGVQKPELIVSYEPLPSGKPNLVITDVWTADILEGGGSAQDAAAVADTVGPNEVFICYQIRNTGQVTASAGSRTDLSLDGGQTWLQDSISVALVPGERLRRCLTDTHACSGVSDTVEVCADSTDMIAESDESDNCRQEVWQCDTQAPMIILGPSVSGITADSAVITWDTDEPSDGVVRYSRQSGLYDSDRNDTSTSGHHEVVLSGLAPSAVYHFQVTSADAAENEVASDDMIFETPAIADGTPPDVSFPDPGTISGTVTLNATASDNVGVRKVEFYLDAVLLGTDYSAPYEMTLESPSWPNGPHMAQAVAYDLSGGSSSVNRDIYLANVPIDTADPTVTIQSPEDGETVERGPVTITVFAIDRQPEDLEMYQVDRVEFYVNGRLKETVTEPDSSFFYSYTWRTGGLAEGDYEITVEAYDGRDNSASDSITVHVPAGTSTEPAIEVTRIDLEQRDTWYRTGLRIENVGSRTVHNLEVTDRFVGFQARYMEDSVLDITFDSPSNTCELTWDDPDLLNPGNEIELQYRVVPFLRDGEVDYEIGSSTTVSYMDSDGVTYTQELTIPETGPLDVETALANADYLIVTNPRCLFDAYDRSDVDELLARMGSLAVEKGGVLGYLITYERDSIRDLLKASGDWGSQLDPDWGFGGNVLLVGETEIVPSRNSYDSDILDATEGWEIPAYPVELVDNWYADVTGSDYIPDLTVGRIIGGEAEDLIAPIAASLEGQMDCESALVVTGIGSGHWEFSSSASDIVELLEDVFHVRSLDWGDQATEDERLAALKGLTSSRDTVFYRGHGDIDEWSDGLDTSDLPLDFGSSRPFIFALACLTGYYADEDNIARGFAGDGVPAYIGSTELSERYTNSEMAEKYLDRWLSGSTTAMNAGSALRWAKRDIIEEEPYSAYSRLWVLEYNFYGDPKFGNCSAAASSSTAMTPAGPPPSAVEVTVPEYEVTPTDGAHQVIIPGGAQLLVEGQPLVPYYAVSYDYGSGYEVQGVSLISRAGLTTTTGLNLPPVTPVEDRAMAARRSMPQVETADGWYPDMVYDWDTYLNPADGGTLVIRMYPFYYNPLTTDVRFYRNYSFSIASSPSEVRITHLATDKHAYAEGKRVIADVTIAGGGGVQDVVAQAVIRRYGSGDIVDGLLLQPLDGLRGTATFTAQWDTAGAAQGDYYLEVTLRDTSGNVLDRETADFAVGISSGEITSFTATPRYFRVGDTINIHLAFSNTGTLPIAGTAEIRVRGPSGAVIWKKSYDIANLGAGQPVSFADDWNTTGMPDGSYTLVAVVAFDGQAAGPEAIRVTIDWPKKYFPVILR
jgi:hypothetical protein